ncbi:Glycosyl phosphatidyl inositol protein transamidase complex subunit [Steccherinum ochraceum]|uniref:Glycosyl phosphatidyl inositol protein transamidase complex subunit n=1 Tax=Steccherinum ochraceum TaxID=92696 RepID=A0A4R0RMQ3_9APHY|nr:Glycosyl phosphatidyl inositol protein transamidase complex subunit [Steccherinum ochraceum]
MHAIRQRIRNVLRGNGDRNATRLQRRRALGTLIWSRLPELRLLLLLVGFAWILLIPSPLLGQSTFIDENALHPGQVNTYWNWGDVHQADLYLAQLEQLRDQNATSKQIAAHVSEEFRKLGIPSATQDYVYQTSQESYNGTNAYAVFSSPRGSGAEATLISAPWLSHTEDALNLRGVATVLALAAFLKGYSLWAKDFIFVISSGQLDGMQAFITTYYGEEPSNLIAEPLTLPSGVIWVALNIDYPGHSFSHLGIFFEGINGRLPNQDLHNSVQLISRHTGGVPVVLYDHLDPRDQPWREAELSIIPSWVPASLKKMSFVQEYAYRAKNLVRHVGYQARGKASGVHGLLHRFRIDAITLYAVPATGPHGFHAIGRIMESSLRTINNLLERLHASFFFYLLVNATTFLKIGFFLPAAIILSVAMMFSGLYEWINAAWYKTVVPRSEEKTETTELTWVERPRPVLDALLVIGATHTAGVGLFYFITLPAVVVNHRIISPVLFIISLLLPLAALPLFKQTSPGASPLWQVLKAFNLCLASTVVSVTCVLNFSLACTTAATLSIPLIFSSPSTSLPLKVVKYAFYMLLGFGWMVFATEEVRSAIWHWELMGIWFAPFICIVYTPLVLQAALVSILPL